MSVGSDLKSARESKKISLETISQKTRIPVKYLESLEEDHYEVFPSQTYAKGFIRAYCKVVGLDEKKMTQEFKAQVPEVQVKIEPMNAEAEMEKRNPFLGPRPAVIQRLDAVQANADVELGEDLPELHEPMPSRSGTGRRRVKWRSFYSFVGQVVLVLCFFGVCWLGWEKGQSLFAKFHWPVFKSASTSDTPNASPLVQSAASELAEAESPNDASKTKDPYQHLTIKALDKAWVLVTLDDSTTSQALDMAQGDTRVFQATKYFKLRIGNAGGVDIQLNGKPLGVLGVTGQVVEITLPQGAQTSADKDVSDGD